MRKHLKDLTLMEFDKYKELIAEEKTDWGEILLLFGEDINKLEVNQLIDYQTQISNMHLNTIGVFEEYFINGTRYKLIKRLTDIKAAQFIDFQTYLVNGKTNEILSVFLIPMYLDKQTKLQKLLKRENLKVYEYGTGYDVSKVQMDIYNHLDIGTANELAAFFLRSSTILLDSMKTYLELKNQAAMKLQKKKDLTNQK